MRGLSSCKKHQAARSIKSLGSSNRRAHEWQSSSSCQVSQVVDDRESTSHAGLIDRVISQRHNQAFNSYHQLIPARPSPQHIAHNDKSLPAVPSTTRSAPGHSNLYRSNDSESPLPGKCPLCVASLHPIAPFLPPSSPGDASCRPISIGRWECSYDLPNTTVDERR